MKPEFYIILACQLLVFVALTRAGQSKQPPSTGASIKAGVAPAHIHAQKLLANALRYTDPAHGLVNPASGYPMEGWNQDPKQGLHLRSFTQLTAIGKWVEFLACNAAGQIDDPYRSSEQALTDLERVVKSLKADQVDPGISAKGLLSNFLGFDGDQRRGPLTDRVLKKDFVAKFGESKGAHIWDDLAACKWILPETDGAGAKVKRSPTYGRNFFKGALEPYAEQGLTDEIMNLLDKRVVQIIFGDNVNLTASVAKGIGALLDPSVRENPRAIALRKSMEQFLANQRDGYAHLYDPQEGGFVFGWNATDDQFTGWMGGDGKRVIGRMNYFINEFRGAWSFIVSRFDFPLDGIRAGTFKLKPYVLQDGRAVYVPAAWDGSAFQMLGLSLFMQEMKTPGWRALLKNVVAAELDYGARHELPGFLSESYSGNGNEYSGAVGVPEFAVTKETRITNAPSLYTLGIAYSVDPAGVESFLAAHWPVIETMLTDHGPWEGYHTVRKSVIEFQTAAHTLSLILGFVDTGHENMARYLRNAGLPADPAVVHRVAVGPKVDLLSKPFNVFAWSRKKDAMQQRRENGQFSASGSGLSGVTLAFSPAETARLDLSGRTLQIRYRSATALPGCVLLFSPRKSIGTMKNEAILDLAATGETEGQITIPLPATPALDDLKELVLTMPDLAGGTTLDLTITQFVASP